MVQTWENGFYFTQIKKRAEKYYAHEKGNVYEVYLNIENPYIPFQENTSLDFFEEFKENFKEAKELNGKLTGEEITSILKNNGYDGIIIDDIAIAFYSNQIKNVDNITPTINDDIRLAKKTKTQPTQTNLERDNAWIEREIRKIEITNRWDNSIPVTSTTDIRKTIENYLGLGVKKGHFREDAFAIYKDRDVIRAEELSDIDSILHEMGHALDIGKRLNIDKGTIKGELLNAISRLGGYENETVDVQMEEGFAEIIREYSVVPKQAQSEFPQTVAIIEQFRKQDKKFDKFIRDVNEQTYNYIHQNPVNRILSKQSIGKQTDKPTMSKDWIEQELMRNIWDKNYAVKKAVSSLAKKGGKKLTDIKASENAYNLVRLFGGVNDKITSMLSDGYTDENGKEVIKGLSQLGEILGDDAQRYNDLRAYLVANRELDYKAKDLKIGIRGSDAEYVRNKFSNDTQIKQAAQVIYDTCDGVLQYAVDNGLISEDIAKKLRESNAFYVPMQRVLGKNGNKVGRRGAVADIIKSRKGSDADTKDVLENVIVNASNIIKQVENNNILRALYKQGEEIGLTGSIYDVIPAPMKKTYTADLSLWEAELKRQGVNVDELDLEKTIDIFDVDRKVDSQNLITNFIDEKGKRVYLQFNDEILFNSLMNSNKEFMSNVLKINSYLNMPLRFGATMGNLGFAIPNMISDTMQASIFSKAGFIPIVDNALGILDVLTAENKQVKVFMQNFAPEYAKKIENMYKMYKQTGSTSSTRMSQYRESTQNIMADIYGTKSKTLGIHEKFKPLKGLLDMMTYIPELSEKSTRFRVFERNYNMFKNKGSSDMDARVLAALESRDATQDFGRTGNLTQEINQLIPFSAARVGSVYTFAEKVKANPKQVAMRMAVLTAIGMAIKGLGYKDKEIEELSQRKKDDNFVVKVGDNVVTIKKPQGILRSMLNLSEYIQDLTTGHIEDGKEAERLGNWVNNAIMDNMPADQITGYIPNAIKPLIENAVNKNFYYNTDIVKSYDLDLPDSEQYYEYNSQLAIMLGKALNYSPAKIDNAINGWFGGLGSQITNIMDKTMGKIGLIAQKPEMGAEDTAVGKRFIVNINNYSASVEELYNKKTKLTKKKNGGIITEDEEIQLEVIEKGVSNISIINKQIKEIKKDLTMSGKEKAEQIRILQQQKTDIARQSLSKELIHNENVDKIKLTSLYPTSNSLSLKNYTLELTSDMKQEYAEIVSRYYQRYEDQRIYNSDTLNKIKTKAKDAAKKTLIQKYKSQLIKTK